MIFHRSGVAIAPFDSVNFDDFGGGRYAATKEEKNYESHSELAERKDLKNIRMGEN